MEGEKTISGFTCGILLAMELALALEKTKGNKWQLIQEIKENRRKGRWGNMNMHVKENEGKNKWKRRDNIHTHTYILAFT